MSSTPAGERHQVAVGELDALRRPGRARGVDQGEQVVGPDVGDRVGGSKSGSSSSSSSSVWSPPVAVDDDQRLELRQVLAGLVEHLEEGALDDRDLRAGVARPTYWICSGEEVW